jgi:hypothetical protein
VLAAELAATTTKVGDIDGGPREVPELEIREHSACGTRPSSSVVNDYNIFHPYSGWALLPMLFLGAKHVVCPPWWGR